MAGLREFQELLAHVTTPAFGTKGSNYLETDYYFDPLGRTSSSTTQTARWTTRCTTPWAMTSKPGREPKQQRRQTQSFVAQNQNATTGPSGTSMYELTHHTYDADGNLISCQSFTGLNQSGSLITAPDYTGTNVSRTTYYQYDGDDELTGTLKPNGVATIQTLDNAGEAVNTQTYAAATWDDDEIDLGAGTQRPSLRAIR